MSINNIGRLAILVWMASLALFSATCQASSIDVIKHPEGTVEGCLPNGLRYLILHNDFPASRIEYRLVWRIGAIQQDDSQGGCAHFLEHMAFGGSENFPDRGAVAYLESLGMKYGIDINAYTGQDRTIYMFATPSDMPEQGGVENALRIISDWMDKLIINPDRVKTEKGIIQEELRGYEVDDPFYGLKIGQNRFSRRMPLGTPEEVEAVTADVLKEFYRKWYLPRFAGIVVVGDVDPEEVEAEIKRRFSGIKAGKDPGLQQYSLDYDPARQIMVYTDSLISEEQLEVIIPHSSQVNSTIGDHRRSAVGRVVTNALNYRLAENGIPAEVSNAWYLGSTDHLVFSIREGSGLDLNQAIRKTSSIVNDVVANGFGTDEIVYHAGRVAKRAGRVSRTCYPSDTLCDDFTDYLLSGDRYVSDSAQIEELQNEIASISSEEARELLKEWLASSDVMLMALRTPEEKNDQTALTEYTRSWKAGLKIPADPYVFKAPVAQVTEVVPPPEVLTRSYAYDPSAVTATRNYPSLGITRLTLSNGMTLLLKNTLDDGGVLFSMVAPGGLGAIAPADLPLYGSTASYIDMGGIAKAPDGIGDYMYTNDIALGMALENNWHGFLGSFAPGKSNEFFNLVYEKITDPELRYEDFEDFRSSMSEDQEESVLSKMLRRAPDRQLMARLDELMGNVIDFDAPFDSVSDKAALRRIYADRMNLDSIASFYRSLYTQPEGAVFMVAGNFDADSVARDFVSVFSRLEPTSECPRGFTSLNLPTSTVTERFDSEDKGKTEFDYIYFGEYEPNLRNSLVLKLMGFVMRNRVIADLREKRALVYSPYVVLNYEGLPRGYYYFDISSSTENSHMQAVREALDGVISDLRVNPVTDSELEAIKRSCIINRRETLNPMSPSAWRTLMMNLVKNGESLEDFENYEAIIGSITPEELRDGFNRYINPDLYLLLYISDEDIK